MSTAVASTDRTRARARHLEGEIVKGCEAIRTAWVYLAARLYELDHDRLWESLGYESLSEFLSQPTIELSYSHTCLLIRSYREFVLENDVPVESLRGASLRKVSYLIGPIRTGRLSAQEALAEARSLSQAEIREKYSYQGSRSAPSSDVEVCPTCGSRRRRKA